MFEVLFTDNSRLAPTKIFGVGLNYVKHIEEMRSKRTSEPVIFLKPTSALTTFDQALKIPENFGAVHHEIELAVCIGLSGKDISPDRAARHVAGYGLALDLTLRDIQGKAKKAGQPWAIAKGFDGSCPVSNFVPVEQIHDVENLDLSLSINGQPRQKGNTSQMIFKIQDLISYLSRFFTLYQGDLILTGTPSGVGPLQAGDRIEAAISGIASIQVDCV